MMAEKSSTLQHNNVIKIKCDGITSIFLPKESFHDPQ